MNKYIIGYTATNGTGLIDMDGSNDRMKMESTEGSRVGGGSARRKGERYTYQTTYDCNQEDWLDLYLKGLVATHIVRTDWETGEEKELFTKNRPYPMVHGGGTRIYDGRYLCQIAPPGGKHQAPWLVDEDGEHWEALTPPEEAFVYGMCLNSSKDILAFHVTSADYDEVYDYMPNPYSINTIDLRTGKRTLIDTREGGLLFGPTFSPDDQWLLYVDCDRIHDPAHFFADICIARPDGSEVRHLTQGYSAYFGTAFGPAEHRRGGSNTPVWLDAHTVIYSKLSPGAHPDAGYDASLGNHREEYYDPSQAKGGCQLVKIDIDTLEETPITSFEEGKWDFRVALSPDKEWLAYTSVRSGGHPSEIRICKLDGSENRFLTRGVNGLGVDFATFSDVDD